MFKIVSHRCQEFWGKFWVALNNLSSKIKKYQLNNDEHNFPIWESASLFCNNDKNTTVEYN